MDELNYCIFYSLQISERGSPVPCCIQISPCFANSVVPDQLASMKPADQDPHCFTCILIIRLSYLHRAI